MTRFAKTDHFLWIMFMRYGVFWSNNYSNISKVEIMSANSRGIQASIMKAVTTVNLLTRTLFMKTNSQFDTDTGKVAPPKLMVLWLSWNTLVHSERPTLELASLLSWYRKQLKIALTLHSQKSLLHEEGPAASTSRAVKNSRQWTLDSTNASLSTSLESTTAVFLIMSYIVRDHTAHMHILHTIGIIVFLQMMVLRHQLHS